jgi:hypothetical protein
MNVLHTSGHSMQKTFFKSNVQYVVSTIKFQQLLGQEISLQMYLIVIVIVLYLHINSSVSGV